MKANGRGQRSSTIDHALGTLLLFVGKDILRLTDVAERLGISVTAAFRVVKTLADRNFLVQDPVSKLYRLGPVLYHLAKRADETKDFVNQARLLMQQLVVETRESAYISMLTSRTHYVLMDGIQSPEPVRWVSQIGMPLPLGSGAVGKLHLAYFPEPERRQAVESMPLEAFTPNTPTDRIQLLAELEQIVRQGYAVSRGERHTFAWAISVPVWAGGIEPAASLGLFGLLNRTEPNDSMIQLMIMNANVLSKIMTSSKG